MPVSGHEETGVKSFAGQFSDFVAGVPIKKRRFPTIRPSSPLSEEPSSLPEDTELLRKEHSSTSQGSTLSNASIAGAPIKKRRFPLIQVSPSPCEEPCSLPEENDALRKEHSSTSQGSTLSTSSSGLSDTNKNPLSEERKESSTDAHAPQANKVQSNPNYLIPKLEEPNLSIATQSCTLDVMASKEKVVLKEGYDEKLGSQMTKGKSDLLLAAKEGLALNLGGDINKQNVDVKCKQENLVVPESTDLSLGLKKSSFPTLAIEGIDGSCQKKDETEAVSLKLSLSKEEGSSSSLIGGDKTNSDRTRVQSIRANWDLNTTMDAWEETASNAVSDKTSSDGLKSTGSVLDDKKQLVCSTLVDEKQLMCSTGMVTTDDDCERQAYLENENQAFTVSSTLYFQQHRGGDKHNLCLTSSGLQKFSEESSRLSAKLNTGCVIQRPKVVTSCDTTMPSFRIVKTEPVDENLKQGLKEANPCHTGLLDSVTVKREIVERSNREAFKSNSSNLMADDPKFVKSEPTQDDSQARPKTAEDKSDQLGSESQPSMDNCSSPLAVPMTLVTQATCALTACPSEKPVCSTEMTASANVANHLENSECIEGVNVDGKASHGTCSIADQVSLETVATAKVEKCTESSSNVPVVNDSARLEEEYVEDPDGCRLKLMNELPPGLRVSGEGCASDEEMITLSADMLEDYASDYESDDNHALTVAMDRERYGEEDDYEDGEVREPLQHSTAEETIFEVKEVEHAGCSSYENKLTESGVAVCGECPPTSSHAEEVDNKTAHLKTVTCNEIKTGKDGVDAEISEESDKVADKNVCVRESFNAEKPAVGSDVKRAVKPLQSKSSDLLERKNAPQALEKELSSDQATNGSQGVDVAECADEVVKKADMVRITDSDLPKKEASSNTDDVAKDINNGGNQGRIINLSRAAGASFPGKTRSISGRSLPSRAGRDILSDVPEGDKLHRGRDEYYIDGPRRFSTERHQDLSPRNSRLHFGRGRGRVTNRLDTRGDWDSDREYSGEFYNGPSHFRGPRHKYASNIADADMEYNNIAPDGSFVGTGRLGRKVLNDEGPLCRHIPSRRRSPGGRDVPAGRGIQMGHRIPRDMSPTRCIVGSDGSEMVGMRHNEKFMRGFPDDTLDPPMFTRPQQFDGLDGRFTRGNRNFSSIQRRNIPRIRSKSPVRSRSRSPPWSSPRRRSPRRRSPDGFGGHPEVTHRRSPIYRPDRPVFSRERVVRRNGSPSYMSRPNNIRDIDSGRDHSHPRSVISRSPGGMILRNRRFDVVDPRDRSENDEYFGGPMPSGRMLDLSGEGNGDERRFGERRGPVRSFRPPYNNGAVGENFHLNSGDGPRHYRFCTDDDSDFHERGNLRERDFDRRIKNSRPTNGPPRRTRNIDDQEANYRHGGGQVWSDDSFDDMSRMKRKRF